MIKRRKTRNEVRELISMIQLLLSTTMLNTGHVGMVALIRTKPEETVDEDVDLRTMSHSLIVSIPHEFMNEQQARSLRQLDVFLGANRFRSTGIIVADKLYTCCRADRCGIYAKLKEDTRQGIIIVPTKKHLLVSTYVFGMAPSVCAEVSHMMADYLSEKDQ